MSYTTFPADRDHVTLMTTSRGNFTLGDYVELCGTTMRVVSIDIAGTTLTLRPLRWYERAWLFIAARLKP
jgi:hypothetical protein